MLSITPSYLEQLTQARPKSGKAIQSVKDRLDESLSSILILNTFAHTMGAAGVGGTGFAGTRKACAPHTRCPHGVSEGVEDEDAGE